MRKFTVHHGDCLDVLGEMPDESVQTCVTSPPYWGLRDYGVDGQLGLEETPEQYVERLVAVFREVRRVLRDDGTLWLNLGDSYAGSWGAQSRGGPPSDRSTLRGNGHVGGGPKVNALSKVQVEQHPRRTNTGSADRTPGLKPKDLVGIPWRVAFALQADGWYLRSDIIWAKPNPMPESVTDRPTKSHEYIFLLSKSKRYHYDADAIREESDPAQEAHNQRYARPYDNDERIAGGQPGNVNHVGIHSRPGKGGRNKRTVWTVTTKPFPDAHFAVYPPDLIEPCILAGSSEGDTVLDPFTGSGTTGLVALRASRRFVGIELNPEYAEMARRRIYEDAPLLNRESELVEREVGR